VVLRAGSIYVALCQQLAALASMSSMNPRKICYTFHYDIPELSPRENLLKHPTRNFPRYPQRIPL